MDKGEKTESVSAKPDWEKGGFNPFKTLSDFQEGEISLKIEILKKIRRVEFALSAPFFKEVYLLKNLPDRIKGVIIQSLPLHRSHNSPYEAQDLFHQFIKYPRNQRELGILFRKTLHIPSHNPWPYWVALLNQKKLDELLPFFTPLFTQEAQKGLPLFLLFAKKILLPPHLDLNENPLPIPVKYCEALFRKMFDSPNLETKWGALEALLISPVSDKKELILTFLKRSKEPYKSQALLKLKPFIELKDFPYLMGFSFNHPRKEQQKLQDILSRVFGKSFETCVDECADREFLKALPPFQGVEDALLSPLFKHLKKEIFPIHTKIFEREDLPEKVFFIKKGVLFHFYPVGFRGKRELGRYLPGEHFGDSHILANLPVYQSEGEALEELHLLSLPGEVLALWLENNPASHKIFYRHFVQQVTRTFQARHKELRQNQWALVLGSGERLYRDSLINELSIRLEKEIPGKKRVLILDWEENLEGSEPAMVCKIPGDLKEILQEKCLLFSEFVGDRLALNFSHFHRFLALAWEEFSWVLVCPTNPSLLQSWPWVEENQAIITLFTGFSPQEVSTLSQVRENLPHSQCRWFFGMVGGGPDWIDSVEEWEKTHQIFLDFVQPKKSLQKHTHFVKGKLQIRSKQGRSYMTSLDRVVRKLAARQVGLALSGQFAHALPQIGVLEALEKQGVRIDLISGSGVSGIIAAFYASGQTPGEIRKIIHDSFSKIKPLKGPNELKNYYENFLPTFLNTHFKNRRFEELSLPFFTERFDLHTGLTQPISRGPLIEALLESCQLPTEERGVEGITPSGEGKVPPVLAEVLNQKGAHYLLAVHCHSSMTLSPDNLPPGLGPLFKILEHLQTLSVESQVIFANLLLEPQVDPFHWNDFHLMEELYQTGLRAVELKMGSLLKLMSKLKGER